MDPHVIFENWRQTVTDHYFDTKGRVGRSQFWYFVLANIVIGLIATIVQAVIFLPLAALFNLAMLLPSAGMGARRLQDTGREGKLVWIFIFAAFASQLLTVMSMFSAMSWGMMGFLMFGPPLALLYLINVALLLAMVALIYFWVQPGDPDANAYGPPPPVFDPSRPVSPAA